MRRWLWTTLLSIGLGACGGAAQMMPAGEPPKISQGESMVVFMRSSFVGSAIAASVFDVSGPETRFIGILNNATKIAYPVKTGSHTFMVIGESADFLQANVAAGRTYYALVTPRPGVWKARFSFRPIRQGELDGAEFAGWNSATSFVATSPEALSWAAQNAADVNSKRAQYWPDWANKPEDQRASQRLNAEDGKPVQASALSAGAPQAAAAAPVAAASSIVPLQSGTGGFPREGDTWTYRLTEPKRTDGPKQRNYVAKVASASGVRIVEQYSLDGGASGEWTHSGSAQLLTLGPSLFSPYLSAFRDLGAMQPLGRVESVDPVCGPRAVCTASARIVGREVVKVPAGSFEAVKVRVEQSWRGVYAGAGVLPGGRELYVWYAPAAKRAVKQSSRATGGVYSPFETDYELELVSYKVHAEPAPK